MSESSEAGAATSVTKGGGKPRKPRPNGQASASPKGSYTTDENGGLWLPIAELLPWDKNPRRNDAAVPRVAASLERFGFVAPICLWPTKNRMVAGHTRLKALRSILERDPAFVPKGAPGPGLAKVIFHDFESEEDANAYALADNKLNELAEWDDDLVKQQLARMAESDRVVVGFQEPPIKLAEDTLPASETDVRGHKRRLQQNEGTLTYRVIVECEDEDQQASIIERLEAEGLTCKPIIS